VVRLSDPDGRLAGLPGIAPDLSGVPAPPVTASITDSSGNLRLVPFSGADGSTYNFAMLIPASGVFTLEVGSSHISLASDQGTQIAGNTYRTTLDSSAILGAWTSTPSWLPLWLSPSRGLPSQTIGLTVYGLLP
jgi:hypothetical protein